MRCESVAVATQPESPVCSQLALAADWLDEVGHSMSSMGGRSSSSRPPAALISARKALACLTPSMVPSKKWYGLRMTPLALELVQLAVKVDCVL